jgi:hypothetical protein
VDRARRAKKLLFILGLLRGRAYGAGGAEMHASHHGANEVEEGERTF